MNKTLVANFSRIYGNLDDLLSLYKDQDKNDRVLQDSHHGQHKLNHSQQ